MYIKPPAVVSFFHLVSHAPAGERKRLKMEIYLPVMLGIPAIAGVVFLISFKIQDKRKHGH